MFTTLFGSIAIDCTIKKRYTQCRRFVLAAESGFFFCLWLELAFTSVAYAVVLQPNKPYTVYAAAAGTLHVAIHRPATAALSGVGRQVVDFAPMPNATA